MNIEIRCNNIRFPLAFYQYIPSKEFIFATDKEVVIRVKVNKRTNIVKFDELGTHLANRLTAIAQESLVGQKDTFINITDIIVTTPMKVEINEDFDVYVTKDFTYGINQDCTYNENNQMANVPLSILLFNDINKTINVRDGLQFSTIPGQHPLIYRCEHSLDILEYKDIITNELNEKKFVDFILPF